jgi:hypothetical protein
MRFVLFMLLLLVLTGVAALFLLEPRKDRAPVEAVHPPAVKSIPMESEAFRPPARKAVAPVRYDATVMGCFKDLHGRGLSSVTVELAGEEAVQKTITGKQGVFAVTMETLSAQKRHVVLTGRKQGFATYSTRITIRPAKIVDLGDLVMVRGGSISGCVLDRSGRPIADASVFLIDEIIPFGDPRLIAWKHFGPQEPWRHEVKTASSGVFRMKGVPPGLTQVWAGAEGMMYEHTFQPIEVRPGWDTPGVKLKLKSLPRSEIIEGQVLSPTGAPVPGAVVRVEEKTLNADGQGCFRFSRNSPAIRYVIKAWDPAGRFRPAGMRNVPLGTYDLILRLGRKDPAEE